MTSGAAEAKSKARPVLEALAQGVHDFGEDPVAAHVVKLAGNFLIAAAIEPMAEAYTLGEKCGLDRMQLAEFLGASLFPSRIQQRYGRLIAEHRFERPGFKLKLGLKDMRLVRGAADAHEMPMPVASRLRDRLLALAAKATASSTGPASGLRPPGTRRRAALLNCHTAPSDQGLRRRPNRHAARARCPRRRSVSTA